MSVVNVLVIQTGPSRQNFFAGGGDPSVSTTNRVYYNGINFVVTHKFLTHNEECQGEMEDSKKVLQLAKDHSLHVSLFDSYNTFFSIGSTSTQGWVRDGGGDLHAIIPDASDSSGMFELCGNGTLGKIGKNTQNVRRNMLQSEVTRYVDAIKKTLNNSFPEGGAKVLCFNSIGYHPELNTEIVNVNTLEYGSGVPTTPIIEVLKKVVKGTLNTISIIPRKMVVSEDGNIIDGTGVRTRILKIGGSWVNPMIKNPHLFGIIQYHYIVDSGGGSATAYDTTGKNYTIMSGPNKKTDKWKYEGGENWETDFVTALASEYTNLPHYSGEGGRVTESAEEEEEAKDDFISWSRQGGRLIRQERETGRVGMELAGGSRRKRSKRNRMNSKGGRRVARRTALRSKRITGRRTKRRNYKRSKTFRKN
jgi:hypothetical protein